MCVFVCVSVFVRVCMCVCLCAVPLNGESVETGGLGARVAGVNDSLLTEEVQVGGTGGIELQEGFLHAVIVHRYSHLEVQRGRNDRHHE